jgi:AcrR family transcriptional regulator
MSELTSERATSRRTPIRRSAKERREQILTVALGHFALVGYRGASTEHIAREAGISQSYLFRLFATKPALFLACYDRAVDEIVDVFRTAAASAPDGAPLARMRQAYASQLQAGRPAMLMPLQAFAASWEPRIGSHVRGRLGDVVDEVARDSGAPPDELCAFFATVLLLNVTAALERRAPDDDPCPDGGRPFRTPPAAIQQEA